MIMPGMDGNEIVLWLAQQKCTARLIIITGYTPDYAAHAKVLAEYKRTPAGDNIVQADRSQRASSRVGLARILLRLAEMAQKLDPELKVLFTTGYARETTRHEGACMNARPGFSSRIRTKTLLAS